MDEQLLLWLGIFLLLTTVLDIIITTLSPRGAGFYSKFIIIGVWKLFLWISGKNGKSPFLDYFTTIVSVVMLTFWILGLWMSNSMIVMSDFNSVLNTSKIPITNIEKIYYTGYVLSTLGNGEFIPGSNFWMIYTNLLAYTGLLMITIGITYLVPLLQADIQRRTLCMHIASFGNTIEEILINNWNGKDFSLLSDHFDDLRQEIFYLGQNHKAYPILHHSHSHIRHQSTPITICMIDEALTVILNIIPEENWPNKTSINSLRQAITSYLTTLNSAFIARATEVPPLPNMNQLKNAGIPLASDQKEIAECYKSYAPRRKLLYGLLQSDGWDWNDLDLDSIIIEEI